MNENEPVKSQPATGLPSRENFNVRELKRETYTAKPAQPTPSVAPPPISNVPGSATPKKIKNSVGEIIRKIRDKVFQRRRRRLDKIVAACRVSGRITNNEVERLLHVSDSTATRYLKGLVKEGKLKCVGVRAGAYYEPIN